MTASANAICHPHDRVLSGMSWAAAMKMCLKRSTCSLACTCSLRSHFMLDIFSSKFSYTQWQVKNGNSRATEHLFVSLRWPIAEDWAWQSNKCQHAHLFKQARELNTRDHLLCYQAWFSSLHSFTEAVGSVKWKNLLCDSVFIVR